MPDVSDYELFKTSEPVPTRRSVGLWLIVAVVLCAALATLLYLVWQRRAAPPAAVTPGRITVGDVRRW